MYSIQSDFMTRHAAARKSRDNSKNRLFYLIIQLFVCSTGLLSCGTQSTANNGHSYKWLVGDAGMYVGSSNMCEAEVAFVTNGSYHTRFYEVPEPRCIYVVAFGCDYNCCDVNFTSTSSLCTHLREEISNSQIYAICVIECAMYSESGCVPLIPFCVTNNIDLYSRMNGGSGVGTDNPCTYWVVKSRRSR